MFAWFNQIFQISWMNLKNVPARWGASLVIVVGIAGVVGVLTAVLSMAEGFKATLGKAGQEDRVIVMRSGATSELSSGLSREQALLIKQAPGILRASDGTPMAAAELLVIADLPKKSSLTLANAALRGVQSGSFLLRPEVKIVEGRKFTPGTRELVVGKQASQQFANLTVGAKLAFRDSDWTVVGVFEAAGNVHESELWADAEALQNTYRRNGFQSVSAQLENKESLSTLKAALNSDPSLSLKISTLKEYYANQSKQLSTLLTILGYSIGVIMAVGAVFGALNTMYAAISTRSREIATLRALGFSAGPVVISVLLEAIVLALLGGMIGAALSYLIFNGYTAATLGANFSQVAFDFKVTGALMIQGIVLAIGIGFIGGLLPSWRAARLSVTTALRAL